MKSIRSLLIFVILLGSCAARKYAVRHDDFPGWQTESRRVAKSMNDMKKELGDNYQMYLGYQIEKVVIQTLRTEDYKVLKIEIFITNSENNARGLYRRYQTMTKIPVGTEGSQSPGFASFYRGNNFIRIMAQRNLTGKDQYLLDAAKMVDQKLMK